MGTHDIKIDLYDAFLYEQDEDLLKDENMIYCNNCKKLSEGIYQQKIYSLPKLLIIVLNRGKNNQDFNEEINIEEKLDFSAQVFPMQKAPYNKFYLCGIITHLGKSGSDGHFISYCRNDPNSNEFICYNDASSTKVDIKRAMEMKISTKENEKKTPYILFYHYY